MDLTLDILNEAIELIEEVYSKPRLAKIIITSLCKGLYEITYKNNLYILCDASSWLELENKIEKTEYSFLQACNGVPVVEDDKLAEEILSYLVYRRRWLVRNKFSV